MTDYSMSDDLFRLRAGEEDGCMISSVGAGLARAMHSTVAFKNPEGLLEEVVQ